MLLNVTPGALGAENGGRDQYALPAAEKPFITTFSLKGHV